MRHIRQGFSIDGGTFVKKSVLYALQRRGVLHNQGMPFRQKIAITRKLLRGSVEVPVTAFRRGDAYQRQWPGTVYLYNQEKGVCFALVPDYNLVPACFTPRFTQEFAAYLASNTQKPR